MKCPMRRKIEQSSTGDWGTETLDCLKEDCAWWRDDIQMCAIKDLSLELGYTQQRLADIADKMPTATQFLK